MKKLLRSYGIIFAGSVLYSLAFAAFFEANQVGMAGVTGLAGKRHRPKRSMAAELTAMEKREEASRWNPSSLDGEDSGVPQT